MFDEIVKTVQEKAGVSEEVAKKAVDATIAVLEDKLPDVVKPHVRSVLGMDGEKGEGDGEDGDLMDSVMDAAKGFF
jgi:hypothetical protein